MERLTEREPYWLGEEFWTSAREPDDEEIDAVYERLKYYEDLEEDGKLLKLPCKPGDTVYLLVNDGVNKPFIREWKTLTFMSCISLKNKIGKTVYLTEQEALEALEGMKK